MSEVLSPGFIRPKRDHRMWEPGEGFISLAEMVAWIDAGGMVYLRNGAIRPTPYGWLQAMQLNTLKAFVRTARRAVRREEV